MPLDLNLAALYMRVGDQYVPIPGVRGEPGVSPAVAVTDITGGHRVTITDDSGTHSFDVLDGANGSDGAPGAAGFSPTVSVTDITGGHRVTITDATGSHSFDVMDGADGSTPVLTVIHITGSSPNYVSDVSYADAMTAYTNGALLYAVRNDAVYGLYRVEASRLLFARTYIANNTVAIDTVSFTSTGAIGLGNQIVHPPKMLTFSLTSNGPDAYADPPTGTLGVEISDIDDISYAYHAAAGTSDDYVILGLRNGAPGSTPPDPYEMYSIQSATWDEETGPETVATLTFRCVGFRNGVPVIKTITVSDTPWTYDSFENAVVSYSETALAVSP